VLVPALLRWPYRQLDPELRKAFEVALHGGTAVALAFALRREVADTLAGLRPGTLARIALSFAPAAAAGLAFERTIERRLGDPRLVACAQIAAGTALWAADRNPGERRARATARDALAIGLAQAGALVPGVSRGGATLTAARLRGFERREAGALARQVALPVIAGAAALKGARLARTGMPPDLRLPFLVGACGAFVATLASYRLVGVLDQARSYAPIAGYRIALGAVALAALRRSAP
jgi:undecaprenyl-diphosphatase